MSKYYVQCGLRSIVINAIDEDVAAMHLMDVAMQPHAWIYDDAGLSEQDRHDHLMLEALLHLAPEISVSQQGFDRADAKRLGTPETITRWHQTMVGVGRMLAAAGLLPRRLGVCQAEPATTKDGTHRTRSGNQNAPGLPIPSMLRVQKPASRPRRAK